MAAFINLKSTEMSIKVLVLGAGDTMAQHVTEFLILNNEKQKMINSK